MDTRRVITTRMGQPGRPRGKELSAFGERLRAAIVASDAFANRAEFLRHHALEGTTLYRYETGERQPSIEDVKAWAASLGVSVASLIGEETVERDDELSTALGEFLASIDPDDPKPPTADEVTWLKGLAFRELRLAGLRPTPSLYGRVLREKRLQESGRISSGQELNVEATENTLDLPETPKRRATRR